MTAADASQVHDPHTLYSHHHGWLRAWLHRRLGCRDEAADLTQDTFLRVLLRPQALHGLREPRAYLTTIAKGLLADLWRRRALEQAYRDIVGGMSAEDARKFDALFEIKHKTGLMVAKWILGGAFGVSVRRRDKKPGRTNFDLIQLRETCIQDMARDFGADIRRKPVFLFRSAGPPRGN